MASRRLPATQNPARRPMSSVLRNGGPGRRSRTSHPGAGESRGGHERPGGPSDADPTRDSTVNGVSQPTARRSGVSRELESVPAAFDGSLRPTGLQQTVLRSDLQASTSRGTLDRHEAPNDPINHTLRRFERQRNEFLCLYNANISRRGSRVAKTLRNASWMTSFQLSDGGHGGCGKADLAEVFAALVETPARLMALRCEASWSQLSRQDAIAMEEAAARVIEHHAQTLVSIELSGNLTPMSKLVNSLIAATNLTFVDFSDSEIKPDSLGPICELLKGPSLTELRLNNCCALGDRGVAEISKALAGTSRLEKLLLCYCNITDVGARDISLALRTLFNDQGENMRLRVLDLSSNRITPYGARALFRTITKLAQCRIPPGVSISLTDNDGLQGYGYACFGEEPMTPNGAEYVDVVGSSCKVLHRVGSGSFGEIWKVFDLRQGQRYAIKVEDATQGRSQLRCEHRVYSALRGAPGFPKCYFQFSCGSKNLLGLELLGDSLETLYNARSRRFPASTVAQIGLQLLNRLRTMHSKQLLHRDLKPDNFLIGRHEGAHIVHAIDMGLARRYVDQNRAHIPERSGRQLIGTPRYASLNCHHGFEPTRRDDCESLCLMLIYFIKGQLPWQGIKAESRAERNAKIGRVKASTQIDTLCQGCPSELADFLRHCRGLRFCEEPDYELLRKLLGTWFCREEQTLGFARPRWCALQWVPRPPREVEFAISALVPRQAPVGSQAGAVGFMSPTTTPGTPLPTLTTEQLMQKLEEARLMRVAAVAGGVGAAGGGGSAAAAAAGGENNPTAAAAAAAAFAAAAAMLTASASPADAALLRQQQQQLQQHLRREYGGPLATAAASGGGAAAASGLLEGREALDEEDDEEAGGSGVAGAAAAGPTTGSPASAAAGATAAAASSSAAAAASPSAAAAGRHQQQQQDAEEPRYAAPRRLTGRSKRRSSALNNQAGEGAAGVNRNSVASAQQSPGGRGAASGTRSAAAGDAAAAAANAVLTSASGGRGGASLPADAAAAVAAAVAAVVGAAGAGGDDEDGTWTQAAAAAAAAAGQATAAGAGGSRRKRKREEFEASAPDADQLRKALAEAEARVAKLQEGLRLAEAEEAAQAVPPPPITRSKARGSRRL